MFLGNLADSTSPCLTPVEQFLKTRTAALKLAPNIGVALLAFARIRLRNSLAGFNPLQLRSDLHQPGFLRLDLLCARSDALAQRLDLLRTRQRACLRVGIPPDPDPLLTHPESVARDHRFTRPQPPSNRQGLSHGLGRTDALEQSVHGGTPDKMAQHAPGTAPGRIVGNAAVPECHLSRAELRQTRRRLIDAIHAYRLQVIAQHCLDGCFPTLFDLQGVGVASVGKPVASTQPITDLLRRRLGSRLLQCRQGSQPAPLLMQLLPGLIQAPCGACLGFTQRLQLIPRAFKRCGCRFVGALERFFLRGQFYQAFLQPLRTAAGLRLFQLSTLLLQALLMRSEMSETFILNPFPVLGFGKRLDDASPPLLGRLPRLLGLAQIILGFLMRAAGTRKARAKFIQQAIDPLDGCTVAVGQYLALYQLSGNLFQVLLLSLLKPAVMLQRLFEPTDLRVHFQRPAAYITVLAIALVQFKPQLFDQCLRGALLSQRGFQSRSFFVQVSTPGPMVVLQRR